MSSGSGRRERPLSGAGALRALWSRLRRAGSRDSVSSGDSTRTAASFAFLPPGAGRAPRPLPPPPSPTASYTKRVRHCDARRQYERGITLQRKYHLPIGGISYDAATLPTREAGAARRQERCRRARSECIRSHVPGKRPAPPPPAGPDRRPAKRRAPPPPHAAKNNSTDSKENRNSSLYDSAVKVSAREEVVIERSIECKSEKISRQESVSKKVPEKSFFRQIFENKKRNSAIEAAPLKLLANISELDRQTTALLAAYRLRAVRGGADGDHDMSKSTGNMWFCTRCLKRYDSSTVTCMRCLSEAELSNSKLRKPENNYQVTSKSLNSRAMTSMDLHEKEKLKDMLKEIKDSLPNRSKASKRVVKTSDTESSGSKETPTLPMGCTPRNDFNYNPDQSKDSNNKRETLAMDREKFLLNPANTVVITETIVLQDRGTSTSGNNLRTNKNVSSNSPKEQPKVHHKPKEEIPILNPIYIPKDKSVAMSENNPVKQGIAVLPTTCTAATSSSATELRSSGNNKETTETIALVKDPPKCNPSTSGKLTFTNNDIKVEYKQSESKGPNNEHREPESTASTTKTFIESKSNVDIKNPIVPSDHYYKRRELINKLETSIARGDEAAAAEAAAKLAQLRLTCSVLSFSSQVGAKPTDANSNRMDSAHSATKKENSPESVPSTSKVNSSTQSVLKLSKINPLSNRSKPAAPMPDMSPKLVRTTTTSEGSNPEPEGAKTTIVDAALPASSSNATTETNDDFITIQVWIEDRAATRGPVPLVARRRWRLAALRAHAARELRLPAAQQRWVVGRALCPDDATVASLAGERGDRPFYVCLVDSNATTKTKENSSPEAESRARGSAEGSAEGGAGGGAEGGAEGGAGPAGGGGVYAELVALERAGLVPNAAALTCGVCLEPCAAGAGAALRECAHAFCRACLRECVRAGGPAAQCPALGCDAEMQEREVRALLPREELERWLSRGLAAAARALRGAVHCRTRACAGWALAEPGARAFPCPVCRQENCLPCQAIHSGESCSAYRARLSAAAAAAAGAAGAGAEGAAEEGAGGQDAGTRALLAALEARGEALRCPECAAVIIKKWGCDWLRCVACKTEICWVTRGRRWGPAGRGDTTAGCRCGVDGKRCHPACAYCH